MIAGERVRAERKRMTRALLSLAWAASLLASGIHVRGEDSGEASCGLRQTWRVSAGQPKRCCTNPALGSVKQFKYTVESVGGEGEEGKGAWGWRMLL